MNSQATSLLAEPATDSFWRIYHSCVSVVLGALVMTATLPGRTFGLGLITKPLLADLRIAEQEFSALNFWAVLLGAALAWPVGWMVDRWGTRLMGTLVMLALGAAVVMMSKVAPDEPLFPSLLLVRALGQGALSIVSVAMVGKWFSRRLGPAMGVYAVLLAIGFVAGNEIVGKAVEIEGWRFAWSRLGYVLLGMAPVLFILVRSTPESVGLPTEPVLESQRESSATREATLGQALHSPAFWIYSLAAALWGLVFSAVTLFSQPILDERGFGPGTYLHVMAILAGFGVVCNLLGGWLAMHWPLGRLLGMSMIILAGALLAFPFIRGEGAVIAYALALGGSGGLITVVFFTFYGRAFGRTQLGRIQGTAHILSVFASALGPVLLTSCKEWTGAYDDFFLASAPVMLIVGLAGWRVAVPQASRFIVSGSRDAANAK